MTHRRRIFAALVATAGALVTTGCLPPPAPRPYYQSEVQAQALPPPKVTVTDHELVPNQSIFFEFDQDRILPISFPILDEIAKEMRAHAEIYLLRIEGHTDSRGTPTYNLNLSYRRALSVMAYLQRRGVKEVRMRAAGFGQGQPIADNTSEEGRARNRRVSFVIQERAQKEARR